MGFCRLLYWHVRQIILSFKNKDFAPFSCFWVPRHLTRGSLDTCFGSFLTRLCKNGTLPKIGPDDPGSFLSFWVFGSPSLSASPYRHCIRSHFLSFILMLNLLAMMTVEPMFHCLADSSDEDGGSGGAVRFYCDAWTDDMSLAYEP